MYKVRDLGSFHTALSLPPQKTVPQRMPSAQPSLMTKGKSELCPGPGWHQGSRSFQLPVVTTSLHRAAVRMERNPHLGHVQHPGKRKVQQQGWRFWKPTRVTSNLGELALPWSLGSQPPSESPACSLPSDLPPHPVGPSTTLALPHVRTGWWGLAQLWPHSCPPPHSSITPLLPGSLCRPPGSSSVVTHCPHGSAPCQWVAQGQGMTPLPCPSFSLGLRDMLILFPRQAGHSLSWLCRSWCCWLLKSRRGPPPPKRKANISPPWGVRMSPAKVSPACATPEPGPGPPRSQGSVAATFVQQ